MYVGDNVDLKHTRNGLETKKNNWKQKLYIGNSEMQLETKSVVLQQSFDIGNLIFRLETYVSQQNLKVVI